MTSACAFAYGLGKAIERAPPVVKKFGVIIPLLATSAANISNIGFTRIDEIVTGTPVTDEEGKVYKLIYLFVLIYYDLYIQTYIFTLICIFILIHSKLKLLL